MIWELIIAFFKIGLFALGGGYAVMPLLENEVLIAHQWLTYEEFTHLIALSEMTPGSIIINAATFVGLKVEGFWGGIIATLAVILPALILASLLAFLYYRYRSYPFLQNILKALRPVIIALIIAFLVRLIFDDLLKVSLNQSIVTIILFALTYLAYKKIKIHPIFIMLGCGGIFLVTYMLGIF